MAKNILILGGGNGGTMIANKLRKHLARDVWNITVIDKDNRHIYQPGLLLVPFGLENPHKIVKQRSKYIAPGITFVLDIVTRIDLEKRLVKTVGMREFSYDFLVISTGCMPDASEDAGLSDALGRNAFTFYDYDGSLALQTALKQFNGGKLVVAIASLPIKCPVAPLEFALLADWYFTKRGIRNKVDIRFVTPAMGAFTKARTSAVLGEITAEKNIAITANWNLGTVNAGERRIENMPGTERIDYDLLVAIPTNVGAKVATDSDIDDGMGYVPTDPHTLQVKGYSQVYTLGDASNTPASKAGSSVHYQTDTVLHNILCEIHGRSPEPLYDGHAT
ncbi:MAG TPA: FAD/NAD(P)-binding oxidoreductase [Candidatus Aquicultor sp.]|jgi:sulfide:quinone oxidoreductase